MKKIGGLIYLISIFGCAKIPVQSVGLMQQIQKEGERMHRLNVAYINKLFNEKLVEINEFIEKEYTPEIIKNLKAQIKKKEENENIKIDMNVEWPTVVPKVNARVNSFKDSLTNALMNTHQQIITKLNEDYQTYDQACETQLNLLNSAVKLNETSKQAADAILKKISNDKFDMNSVEVSLDNLLTKGDNAAQMILNFQSAINNLLHKN